MNNLGEKQPLVKHVEGGPIDIVKNKEELLRTRIQSFTSKEASDACKGMNERILERTALMCERISNSGTNPSKAVLTIAHLSKHEESKEETLNLIMDKLEERTDRWFAQSAETLSQKISPEKFLKSIPLIEAISNWNKRVYAPAVEIDDDKMILISPEIINSMNDSQLSRCFELGKQCLEKSIKPDDLYGTLLAIAGKNPTEEQFNTIFTEFSKLLPTLKEESEMATPFFMDQPGDEKKFVYNRPEWVLDDLSKASYSLPLEDFIKKLKKTREYYELNSLFTEAKADELVVVVGSHSYKPDLKKYGELLTHFTTLLDETQTPADPKLAELKEAIRTSVGYNEEHSSQLCKTALEKWKKRGERWNNKNIAERWIPNELGVLLSRMSAVQEEGTDIATIKEVLLKNNIQFKMSSELAVFTTWPKDMNACVLDTDGRVKAYVRNLPSEAQEQGCFIGEGGASVPGPGFTIFSDSVDSAQIKNFKSSAFGTSYTYQFPSGYTTLRLPAQERNVLLETMHVDTVMAVIPGSYAKDRKPILLVDPDYYKEVSENPRYKAEFQRLLEEQGLKNRVVVIPEEEVHLNPANLAFVRGEREFILMNDAKKTIEMLVEKGLEKDRIITAHVEEMHAFRGGIGCCVSRAKAEEFLA